MNRITSRFQGETGSVVLDEALGSSDVSSPRLSKLNELTSVRLQDQNWIHSWWQGRKLLELSDRGWLGWAEPGTVRPGAGGPAVPHEVRDQPRRRRETELPLSVPCRTDAFSAKRSHQTVPGAGETAPGRGTSGHMTCSAPSCAVPGEPPRCVTVTPRVSGDTPGPHQRGAPWGPPSDSTFQCES